MGVEDSFMTAPQLELPITQTWRDKTTELNRGWLSRRGVVC